MPLSSCGIALLIKNYLYEIKVMASSEQLTISPPCHAEQLTISPPCQADDAPEVKQAKIKIYDELKRRFGEDFIPAFNNNFSQASLFTEDSIFLPNAHGVIHGREAADARNRAVSSDRNPKCTDWEVVDIGVLSPDYVYTIFTMICQLSSGKVLNVRSFSIWKKIDGVWMIYRDTFNW